MTTGRRWYLMAYDRDRLDWRSLRLDRMALYFALIGCDFEILEPPEVAEGAVKTAERLRLAAAKTHH